MIKKNHWVSTEYTFAEWEIELNNPKLDTNDYLDFAQKVLEIGWRELRYSVRHIERKEFLFQAKENYSYADYLRETAKQSERLPFFSFLPSIDRATCDISYYNSQGKVTDDSVDNLGLLLEELHSDKLDAAKAEYEKLIYLYYMKHNSPLVLRGIEFWVQKERNTSPSGDVYYPCLWIRLPSDIWFPKVDGLLENPPPSEPYDNRELALRHTPAFNRFLNEVRTLTFSFGSQWNLNRDRSYYYQQVSETGIILPDAN